MDGLTKLLLISIFDALLARGQYGRFSVSWGYTPHGTFSLNAQGEDGMLLFNFVVGSQTLRELRSLLSAEATADAKRST